jgi:hypothetical protein
MADALMVGQWVEHPRWPGVTGQVIDAAGWSGTRRVWKGEADRVVVQWPRTDLSGGQRYEMIADLDVVEDLWDMQDSMQEPMPGRADQ